MTAPAVDLDVRALGQAYFFAVGAEAVVIELQRPECAVSNRRPEAQGLCDAARHERQVFKVVILDRLEVAVVLGYKRVHFGLEPALELWRTAQLQQKPGQRVPRRVVPRKRKDQAIAKLCVKVLLKRPDGASKGAVHWASCRVWHGQGAVQLHNSYVRMHSRVPCYTATGSYSTHGRKQENWEHHAP